MKPRKVIVVVELESSLPIKVIRQEYRLGCANIDATSIRQVSVSCVQPAKSYGLEGPHNLDR